MTINFETGSSFSEKLVDKLVTTYQNIPSSLECDPNLFEYSVATIMRVLRHSGIYLIRSRVFAELFSMNVNATYLPCFFQKFTLFSIRNIFPSAVYGIASQ